jgi:excisionase family DNA binding protein
MTTAQLVTETEAAQLLRVSRSTVRRLLQPIRLSQRGKRYRLADIFQLANPTNQQKSK